MRGDEQQERYLRSEAKKVSLVVNVGTYREFSNINMIEKKRTQQILFLHT